MQAAAGEALRFRLPANDPPILRGCADAFASAGFRAREWSLSILERPLDDDHPAPAAASPALLVLDDVPAAVVKPPD
jgi:hypothetical protein